MKELKINSIDKIKDLLNNVDTPEINKISEFKMDWFCGTFDDELENAIVESEKGVIKLLGAIDIDIDEKERYKIYDDIKINDKDMLREYITITFKIGKDKTIANYERELGIIPFNPDFKSDMEIDLDNEEFYDLNLTNIKGFEIKNTKDYEDFLYEIYRN